MKKIIGIYKITNPNGRVYIGQSNNCLFRWRYFYCKLNCKRQRSLYNSLVKYGVSAHSFEIIEECELFKLDDLECHYINQYNSMDKLVGMNLRSGGNRPKFSKETRELMRQALLGNTHMLGKSHSDKTKNAIRKAKLGSKDSEETKKRKSEARIGHKHSLKTKQKLSKANKFTRKIKNMKTNIIHKSITQAAIEENISQSTIYRGLKDGRYEYF
jgi:group I intron endonuclease